MESPASDKRLKVVLTALINWRFKQMDTNGILIFESIQQALERGISYLPPAAAKTLERDFLGRLI